MCHKEAWETAWVSTVERSTKRGTFALPFGFVQSMALASLALDQSAVGKVLRAGDTCGVKISLYVDDILLSAPSADTLSNYILRLQQAATASGFRFNPEKLSLPADTAEAFNIILSRGGMHVTTRRMAEFERAVRNGTPETAAAIVTYLQSINPEQAARLKSQCAGPATSLGMDS
jgi:hypothetical protein